MKIHHLDFFGLLTILRQRDHRLYYPLWSMLVIRRQIILRLQPCCEVYPRGLIKSFVEPPVFSSISFHLNVQEDIHIYIVYHTDREQFIVETSDNSLISKHKKFINPSHFANILQTKVAGTNIQSAMMTRNRIK